MTPLKFLKSLYDADKITPQSYNCGVSLLKGYVPLECARNDEAVILLARVLTDWLEDPNMPKTRRETEACREVVEVIGDHYIVDGYDGPPLGVEPVRENGYDVYSNAATTDYADQSAITWQPPPAKKPRAPKKPKVAVPVVTEPPRRRFA